MALMWPNGAKQAKKKIRVKTCKEDRGRPGRHLIKAMLRPDVLYGLLCLLLNRSIGK